MRHSISTLTPSFISKPIEIETGSKQKNPIFGEVNKVETKPLLRMQNKSKCSLIRGTKVIVTQSKL